MHQTPCFAGVAFTDQESNNANQLFSFLQTQQKRQTIRYSFIQSEQKEKHVVDVDGNCVTSCTGSWTSIRVNPVLDKSIVYYFEIVLEQLPSKTFVIINWE